MSALNLKTLLAQKKTGQTVENMIIEAVKDIQNRPDVLSPRRKITLSFGIYRNEKQQVCVMTQIDSKFPGPSSSDKFTSAVNIVGEGDQFSFDFAEDPEPSKVTPINRDEKAAGAK